MKRDQLKDLNRIMIKIGTNSIMKSTSQIDYRKLDRLAYVVSSLMQQGKELMIVSSGAVGVGASILGLDEYPKEIPEQQALAAVGQSELMGHYGRFFNYYGQTVAQMLLTRDVLEFPTSRENAKNTLLELLAKKIVPIINENDVVAVDEMNHRTRFGDNDNLSAMVAVVSEADLLVIMSDVDGLYDSNPYSNPEARKLSHITEINEEVMAMASGKGSEFATGGMQTKLTAAERMLAADSAMMIVSAEDPSVLFDVFAGEDVGTLFAKGDA